MDGEIVHSDSSQNSYSNSSKDSSNAIPNLTEKLRIIGGDVSFSFDKRTVPKRRPARGNNVTLKRRDAVVDVSIFVDDDTKETIDPRSLPENVLR